MILSGDAFADEPVPVAKRPGSNTERCLQRFTSQTNNGPPLQLPRIEPVNPPRLALIRNHQNSVDSFERIIEFTRATALTAPLLSIFSTIFPRFFDESIGKMCNVSHLCCRSLTYRRVENVNHVGYALRTHARKCPPPEDKRVCTGLHTSLPRRRSHTLLWHM